MPKQDNSKKEIWFGYDIKTSAGIVPRLESSSFWIRQNPWETMRDVRYNSGSESLMGLSHMLLLNTLEKSPGAAVPDYNPEFVEAAWQHLEPHYELYSRAQGRLKNYQRPETPEKLTKSFEAALDTVLKAACSKNEFHFKKLFPLINAIEDFENQSKRPLIFNLNIHLSKPALGKLHYLYSLLFHARSLVAEDFNRHARDVTYTGLRVDSITDYLPKSEYVANDAMLFWMLRQNKEGMSPEAANAMEKAFWGYAHNGACLVESLPKKHLESLSTEELERALYIVQMDWLLGAPGGLMFKIREELFGAKEGMEKVFWPDQEFSKSKEAKVLSYQCHLNEKKVFTNSEVA